jgi:scyllo-inositol 2-dehydrogenase (NADP+)
LINVGVVGYGFAGRSFHSYLINRVPDMRLAAVATRSPERRALAQREYGVTTYGTLDEMLAASDIDLVVIATPHDTHKSLAIRAMNAGRNVVVDKVMCLNGAEADEMIEASHRNGVLLSVFHNRRWDWDYLTVRKAIEGGLIGSPYLFEVAIVRYHASRGWRNDVEAGGGILYDWGAHLIDHALGLVPSKIVSVTCDIQHRGWGAEIGSYARLLIRFQSDVLYSIELGNLGRYDKPRWLVLGETGAIVKTGLDPQEPAMLAGNIEAAVERPENRARVTTDVQGFATEMVIESVHSDWTNYYRNIADALRGRAGLLVKPEQIRRAMAILDAAMVSAKTGETVKVGV